MSTTQGERSTDPTARAATMPLVLGAVVLAAVFVALAVAVAARWAPLLALDTTVEPALHRVVLADPALLGTARVVTDLGSPLAMDLLTLIAAIALLAARRVRAAIYVAVARLVELGVETVTKTVVDRPRPVWADPVAFGSSSSFPSGHSAGTAVVVIALVVLGSLTVGRPTSTVGRAAVGAGTVLGALLIIVVPISRVLLGVHYVTDVTAGVALGAAVALALAPILRPSTPDPQGN